MKGDFSKWGDLAGHNFSAVVEQQGRVLLDSDWNAQIAIAGQWQEQMGRTMLGHDLVAVSEERAGSFQVTDATTSAGQVRITVSPGEAWLNGNPLFLGGQTPLNLTLDELPATEYGASPASDYQAVILEMWEETVSGYQMPSELLEPALGGPDTTGRMQRCFAFRSVPVGSLEDAEKIFTRVKDDRERKGRLVATLQSPPADASACPLNQAGGYTGFEHNLYRVEIAQTNAAVKKAMFKWSRYNGGLAGRGIAGGKPWSIKLLSNLTAIQAAGRDSFYVEVVRRDPMDLRWRPVYGAEMALAEGVLTPTREWLDGSGVSGTFVGAAAPAENDDVFVRLWDGIAAIEQFAKAKLFEDGIVLEFDPEAPGNYRPGDYWVFPVRVGQQAGDTLLPKQRPQGIAYHRAPLAVLKWGGSQSISAAQNQIQDLRTFFRPLTKIQAAGGRTCCTFTVGDGRQAQQGDYNTLGEALAHLPADGGQICLLPGTHRFNETVNRANNVRIYGCAGKSKVIAADSSKPALTIRDSTAVQIDSLWFADAAATSVAVDQSGLSNPSAGVKIAGNLFQARQTAIDIRHGWHIEIRENRVEFDSHANAGPAIFVQATDAEIVRNRVVTGPADSQKMKAQGGIQIGAASERILVRENLVDGGTGHGIALGHFPPGVNTVRHYFLNCYDIYGHEPGAEEIAAMMKRFESFFIFGLRIERNEIRNMGGPGIGAIAFFELENRGTNFMFGVHGAAIEDNWIHDCAREVVPTEQYGAIALADAENVAIRRNVLKDNGALDGSVMMSGIYILLAEDVAIEDNFIRNLKGPTVDMRCCGIQVHMAFQPPAERGETEPFLHGPGPAVRICGNQVIEHKGLALAVTGMGAMEISGNSLASNAIIETKLSCAAALVLNLGLPTDVYYPFNRCLLRHFPRANVVAVSDRGVAGMIGGLADPGENQPSPDWRRSEWRKLPRGKVQFHGNTVVSDLEAAKEQPPEYPAMSLAVVSHDDVSFRDNVSECNSTNACVYFNAILCAPSVRTHGNRFAEGYNQAYFSLLSIGMQNTTIGNQANHCLMSFAKQGFLQEALNTVLLEQRCNVYSGALGSYFK